MCVCDWNPPQLYDLRVSHTTSIMTAVDWLVVTHVKARTCVQVNHYSQILGLFQRNITSIHQSKFTETIIIAKDL